MDIRGLLEDPSRIDLVAQPIADVKRGTVVGYEALSRFRVEPRVGPDRVFAEASRQGLGVELEATVVRRALRLAREKPPACFLSLNVDPQHLLTPELERAFAEPADLRGVVVELTEHREVEDMKALAVTLAALRERGAAIAVDDAGSGYSGLRQLLELRPQLLKVDRELVTNVHEDAAKHALIQMLGELAGRLDAWLLAEGVETESELSVLRQLRVPLAQGYFLARPTAPWGALLPDAEEMLGVAPPSEARSAVVRRVLEPCPRCSAAGDWPSDALAVRVSEEGRPLAMRFVHDGTAHVRTEAELLRVKAHSALTAVAQRAMTRPERLRWDPIVCIDDRGLLQGVVRMHRLVSALADGDPAPALSAMH